MKIGILCSGGDSPGMNACIRSIVRTALGQGHEVVGFMDGYQGILDREFYFAAAGMNRFLIQNVSGLSKRGGTILNSSRCQEFETTAGLQKAARTLEDLEIDGLIPIGGNGTLSGAHELREFWPGRIIGCPGTIDNDLCGTDFTIGFKTAVQTAVEAIDKLRDTAASHHRMFIVELMGRHCGWITLETAIAAGCEIACIPEVAISVEEIDRRLRLLQKRGKKSIIMAVAEGYHDGVVQLQEKLAAVGCPFATRVVVLGHLLRGGDPCPDDRILATQTGHLAVQAILRGETDQMAGVANQVPTLVPLADAIAAHRHVPQNMVELLDTVSV